MTTSNNNSNSLKDNRLCDACEKYNGYNVFEMFPSLVYKFRDCLKYLGKSYLDENFHGQIKVLYRTEYNSYSNRYEKIEYPIVFIGNLYRTFFDEDDLNDCCRPITNYNVYECVLYDTNPRLSHLDIIAHNRPFNQAFSELTKRMVNYGSKVLYLTNTKVKCSNEAIPDYSSYLPMYVLRPATNRYVFYFIAHQSFQETYLFDSVTINNPFSDFILRKNNIVPNYVITNQFNNQI